MPILAIANQKGGVGKTTSAVTLAAGLARAGLRTLLIDLDSQSNVADCLGLPAGDDLRRLLSPGQQHPLAQVITPSGRPLLDVVRSDKSTAQIKQALAGDGLAGFVLVDALADVLSTYRWVVLDCAPSIDVLQTAALVAATHLLVPARLDQLALKGVRDALQSLVTTKRVSNCQLGGILPTFFEQVTAETREQLRHLVEVFGPAVFPVIPTDTRLREAPRFGQTIWELDPRARSIIGIAGDNGATIGGYAAALTRLQELH